MGQEHMARAGGAREASSGSRRAFSRSKAFCGLYEYKADVDQSKLNTTVKKT